MKNDNDREDSQLLVEHKRWQADHEQRQLLNEKQIRHWEQQTQYWDRAVIMAFAVLVVTVIFK